MTNKEKNRYSALMLFQFSTTKNTNSNKKRVCEERIIVFEAYTPLEALAFAKTRGLNEELSYTDNGIQVFFEFIGVKELIDISSLESDEVWYRLMDKINPMENRAKLIPDESNLDALRASVPRRHGRTLVPGRH